MVRDWLWSLVVESHVLRQHTSSPLTDTNGQPQTSRNLHGYINLMYIFTEMWIFLAIKGPEHYNFYPLLTYVNLRCTLSYCLKRRRKNRLCLLCNIFEHIIQCLWSQPSQRCNKFVAHSRFFWVCSYISVNYSIQISYIYTSIIYI